MQKRTLYYVPTPNNHQEWNYEMDSLPKIACVCVATLISPSCQYWFGPPFAFGTALIDGINLRSWKKSPEILVYTVMTVSHSCCKFVSCTSVMWISCSTSRRYVPDGDWGGHFSLLNLLSCSRKQFEMIWSLWHINILVQYPSGSSHDKLDSLGSLKDGHGLQQYSGRLWWLNEA